MQQSSGELDYTVRVHHEDGSYWAEVEELPGAFAAGDTEEELWECLVEAVSAYLSTPTSRIRVAVAGKAVIDQAERVEAKLAVC